jgi:hypothetical protein
MTVLDMVAKLTAMLGSTGVSIPSASLQSAIDSALDDLARLKPKVQYVPVTLIAGISEYDVPADTYNVLDVVFPDLGTVDPDVFGPVSLADAVDFHRHSLLVILAQKWEQFDNSFGYNWEYNIDTKKVLVMPTPHVNSLMVLRIAQKRTIEELPDSLLIVVEKLALAEALRSLAVTVGGGITSVPIGIGNVSFSSERLTQQADALRAEALKRLGTNDGGGAVLIG